MLHLLKKFICLSIFFLFPCVVYALPDVNELIKKLEDNMEMTSDLKAHVTATQQKVKQGVKVIEMVYYRRDKDDAFLIVMAAPESDKGNGYLKMGDNFWMYRRNTRTFQHINRDESIGGTDAKSDDFEKRKLSELYKPVINDSKRQVISEEMLGKIPVYKFELTAKVNDVDYPKKIYWIRKDTFIPLKEQSFSLSGALMQTAYFLKYSQINSKYVPVNQMYIDEFEKGNKTIVEITDISTTKLEDSLFTKAYLENLSK